MSAETRIHGPLQLRDISKRFAAGAGSVTITRTSAGRFTATFKQATAVK